MSMHSSKISLNIVTQEHERLATKSPLLSCARCRRPTKHEPFQAHDGLTVQLRNVPKMPRPKEPACGNVSGRGLEQFQGFCFV